MSVAPAKVQRVTANDREITDLNFVRNGFRPQRSLSCPFVHALRAGARPSQRCRIVVAHALVVPGDSQMSIALLRNLSRLNRQPFLCRVNQLLWVLFLPIASRALKFRMGRRVATG